MKTVVTRRSHIANKRARDVFPDLASKASKAAPRKGWKLRLGRELQHNAVDATSVGIFLSEITHSATITITATIVVMAIGQVFNWLDDRNMLDASTIAVEEVAEKL